MTLLDFPGRVAATLFLGGCNLRCPFCHNASLVLDAKSREEYEDTEILSYLEKRRGLLDGVCVTGGEPLLRYELPDFLRRVRALGYAVKLDTNGTMPDRLEALLREGLVDYVAMDVKNALSRYGETVGIPDFDVTPIERSIDLLLSGAVDYEFRTTVTKELHTVRDIAALAERIRGARRYFLQGFVDSGDLLSDGLSAASKEEMEKMRDAARIFVPSTELRGV
jgi:pyruvate formate lyase activating enzyme